MKHRFLPALLLLVSFVLGQPALGAPSGALAQRVFSQAGRALLLEWEGGLELLALTLRRPLAPGALGEAELGEFLARLDAGSPESGRLAARISRDIALIESDAEASALMRAIPANPALDLALRARLAARVDELMAKELGAEALERRAFFDAEAARASYAVLRGRFTGGAAPASAEIPDWRVIHDEITTDLYNGYVVRGEPFRANGNRNSMWKVEIHNPRSGRTRTAVFKPRSLGDGDGWNRVPMEYVAYWLNLRLGMDYVPPAAYRYGLEIEGMRFAEGSISHFVPGCELLAQMPDKLLPLSRMAIQSDNRILSVLLHNSDAHFKNLLAGEHWAAGSRQPVFIDFGASLRPGTQVSMTYYPAAGNNEAVFWVRSRTLERLRGLGAKDFEGLEVFLSRDEIRGILSRRDGIVRYFDRLREMYGDEAILLRE